MFKNHPRGLISAALSNMGERFSYYVANAVLTLFLCSKFGLSPTQGALIFSIFYFGIYFLALLGGLIADKTGNYKGTITAGLITMTVGYALLSIPIMTNSTNMVNVLVFTCFSLFVIAFGNGLFKGNLQALVGELYDNPLYEKKRGEGFQIFYVFINIGSAFAPFIAPFLRNWWLKANHFIYNADITTLCHQYLNPETKMDSRQLETLSTLAQQVTVTGNSVDPTNLTVFCNSYLNVFNTGIHYAFIVSIGAMLISLFIFSCTKGRLHNPKKKQVNEVVRYTEQEKQSMAKEIKQRIAALFAVLGVVLFFWFAFHQNTVSLKFFARDFINTTEVAPEVWDFINPTLVVCLTPLLIWLFSALRRRGKEPSTPKKIAIGMGVVMFGYLFLTLISYINGYPSYKEYTEMDLMQKLLLKSSPWVLIGMYTFLTIAELFIAPLGLAFVSKIAPKHMVGRCQGLWLAATGTGNLLILIGAILYEKIPLWICWSVFAIVCAISMIVMLSMVKWLEKVTKEK